MRGQVRKFAEANGNRKLSRRDVLLILKWKLGRVKKSNSETVADENMTAINKAVRDACKPACEIAALEALERVPGIALATATAILTVCHPEKFTIIDRRVLETLDLFPSRLPKSKRGKYKTSDWEASDYVTEFLPKVQEYAKRWGCSLRCADQALWGLSVSHGIEKIIG